MSMSSSSDNNFEYIFKLLIIGASGTGKSCLLHRFIEQKFKEHTVHTVGVEFGSRVIYVPSASASASAPPRSVKLQIWDTAGQERFRSVTRSYYRGAAAALLVFDKSNRESFSALDTWISDARRLSGPSTVLLVVGHKSDISSVAALVSSSEGAAYAAKHNLEYIEASALTGDNVERTFERVAQAVLRGVDDGSVPVSTVSRSNRNSYALHCVQRVRDPSSVSPGSASASASADNTSSRGACGGGCL